MASRDIEKSQRTDATVRSEPTIGAISPMIPGTALLVDFEHKQGLAHGSQDIVLIPAPSADPNDPLNWSPPRKWFALSIVCLWAFMLGSATLSPSITYGAIIPLWRVDATFLNIGAAVCIFNLGFFNIFLSPLSEKYGRRPIYFFSTIIAVVSQILCTFAPNKSAWMVGRVLLGAGAAPFEQLPALTVGDQFFVHQRGLGLSLYVLAIATGSFLGPVAGGFVVESMGWRWVYGWHAIILGGIAILILIGLEETTFDRSVAQDQTHFIRKSFWGMRPLYANNTTKSPLVETMLKPFRIAHLPIVIWCGAMYGFAVTWLSVMAVTIFQVFQAQYGFSFSSAGLTLLGPMVGGILSVYVGGAGTDRFLVWMAKRNGGIMQSEYRLYAVFIGGPLMGAGMWLYGIGAAHNIHWFALIVGTSLVGTGLPIAAEVALGYSIEAYPSLAAEVTVVVIFIRNVIGCAFTFGIEPWIIASGMQNTFIVVGILALFAMVSGGLLIVFGERCRRSSAALVAKLSE